MRAKDIRERAGEEPLTMLTAYDAPTAELVDEAGIDMILVGQFGRRRVVGCQHRQGFLARVLADVLRSHTPR